MSSTLRERNMTAVRKYYQGHKSSVAKQKIMRFLEEKGRVPNNETLLKHGIENDVINAKLELFCQQNPNSKTFKKMNNIKIEKGPYRCSKCGLIKRGHVCIAGNGKDAER